MLGNNGAKLIFLGTNSNTAQSHNGDLYVDEIFWIPNFQKLRKVASGMASQEHLRTTYFSTPSALTHGAYPFWSGELFNKGRENPRDRIELDISHRALAKGRVCEDGQWRQIVTIEDALSVHILKSFRGISSPGSISTNNAPIVIILICHLPSSKCLRVTQSAPA